MSATSLLSRYTGSEGSRLLKALLKEQVMVAGNEVIATDLLPPVITLRELKVGDLLIKQDNGDNDVFLILSGKFQVLVNDRQVATRGPGQHVGEMVAINPSMTRTATVIAVEPSVVGALPEKSFAEMLKKYPVMWQPIALELSRRLDQRKQFHKTPNKTPIIFIGSSTESLPLAEALQSLIPSSVAHVNSREEHQAAENLGKGDTGPYRSSLGIGPLRLPSRGILRQSLCQ